jgi:hypothetical protein
MHFSSDFPAVGCRSSEALWDLPLAQFLAGAFPADQIGNW